MSAQHFEFWPKRLPHAITVPDTSLWDNLAVNARRYSHKAALVFFGQTFTYLELLQKAERLAAYLQGLGVKKGDRVVLSMQNCPQLVIAHFAILRANAVVVPVNPMNRAEELKHYILDPDAKVAITTSDLATELAQANDTLPEAQRLSHLVVTHFTDTFDPASEGAKIMPSAWADWLCTRHALPVLAMGRVHDWDTALNCADVPPELDVGPADLAVLPYTSGTTGLPKGCMHTHSSIMHNAIASGLWGNGTMENVTLVVVPMFHITGMVSLMHTNIAAGACMVIMPRWDRDLAGALIARHKVTHWTNIPTMVIDLMNSPHFASYDMSSLVYIGGGGAAMPQAVAQRLLEQYGLRYAEGYGPDRDGSPLTQQPTRRNQAAMPGHPVHGCGCTCGGPRHISRDAGGWSG